MQVYMVVKDNGPLQQDDCPLAFEVEADAAEAMFEFGGPGSSVAGIELDTFVGRLAENGIPYFIAVYEDGTRKRIPTIFFVDPPDLRELVF